MIYMTKKRREICGLTAVNQFNFDFARETFLVLTSSARVDGQ